MSLTIETTPEVDARLQKEAARRGMDAREYANKLFLRLFVSAGEPAVTESERAADWERLLSFAGSVSSGDPNSGDNERIDADLAKSYADTHEDAA